MAGIGRVRLHLRGPGNAAPRAPPSGCAPAPGQPGAASEGLSVHVQSM